MGATAHALPRPEFSALRTVIRFFALGWLSTEKGQWFASNQERTETAVNPDADFDPEWRASSDFRAHEMKDESSGNDRVAISPVTTRSKDGTIGSFKRNAKQFPTLLLEIIVGP
ncbi:hypothetical protein RAD16_10530 [Bradyrhizobium sp. 18BD]